MTLDRSRHVCIHGHFYQPPRESPWLDAIEPQDSAYPYHDWNERITAECYAPNAAARILDADDRIRSIVNNYARISFDVGPTLLRWLEREAPQVYRAILEADRASRAANRGHGSALAHAYNHPILPLCDPRDRRTQVVWGLSDFERRFGRRPEGLWLPETAVDLATLELLADCGLRFTILAPEQARRVRPFGQAAWRNVRDGRLDTTRPYRARLPSGRSLDLFFFHGPLARAVAFERLLDRGETLARRLLAVFDSDTDRPQLSHLATDGETFGHHHRFGDMALAWALDHLETRGLARLTNYAAFLDLCPPTDEVEIVENTSWSCAHGVERWRADCGCGGRSGGSQAWRGPLREGLDDLRLRLAAAYERSAAALLRDPWEARDDYVEILFDPAGATRERFLARHARGTPSADRRVEVWKLLEMQRHALLMFTSCAWFFDDVSRIETVQNLRHAARAVQLCREVTGEDLEPALLDRLARARSNVPELEDGRRVYLEQVVPARVDLAQVAAHHAASLLFEARPARSRVYGFEAEPVAWAVDERGGARLGLGRFQIASRVTEERADLSLAVLHHGGHELTGGVGPFAGEAAHAALVGELRAGLDAEDPGATARRIERAFAGRTFSFHTLFREEQRRILHTLLGPRLADAAAVLRRLHEEQASAMRLLGELGVPAPAAFRAAAGFVLNEDLRAACAAEPLDAARLERLVEETRRENVPLDREALGLALQRALLRALSHLRSDEGNLGRIEALDRAAILARAFGADLWPVENGFWELLSARYPDWRRRADARDPAAAAWIASIEALSRTLRVACGRDPGPGVSC